MRVLDTGHPEVKLIEPRVFTDSRGSFFESWRASRYAEIGIPSAFRQANVSSSRHGVLRGLHFQEPNPQGKLVSVLVGTVFDVAVDIRENSPRFGTWWGTELSADSHRQIWIPEGFAHGFCVLSEHAVFSYLCTTEYEMDSDHVIRYDDPVIGIEWPVRDPTLSDKDATAPGLDELRSRHLLPRL